MRQPPAGSNVIAGSVAVAGGALAVVGAVISWAKVSLGPPLAAASRSAAGTNTTDGKIVLALGIVVAVTGAVIAFAPRRDVLVPVAVVAILGGMAVTALAIYDLSRKSDLDRTFVRGFRQGFEQATGQRLTDAQIRVLMARFGIKLSLGPGLYVALAGGLVGAAGGVIGLVSGDRLPREPAEPETAPSPGPPSALAQGPPAAPAPAAPAPPDAPPG
jgi:hypothetical protein